METEKPTEKPKKKRNRKKDYPGSIYKPASCQTLYIRVLRQRISTGLPANSPESWVIAKEMAWQLYKKKKGVKSSVSASEAKIPTVLEAYAKYEEIVLKRLEEKTVRNYKWAYHLVFSDPKQALTLNNVKKMVQDFVDTSKLSLESISAIIRSLNPFIKFAQKRGLLRNDNNESLAESPAISLYEYKPRVPKKEPVPFEPEEIAQLVEYWATRDAEFSRLLKFIYATGFRINEAISLEWAQIDRDIIRLSNKITDDVEYFPLTNEVKEILALQPRDRERVFRWDKLSSILYRWLIKSLEELKIPRREEKSFHSIRKAFAMRLWHAGLSTAEVMALMRHKQIDLTLGTYTKFKTEELGTTLDKIF